jgi:hypothetical protein
MILHCEKVTFAYQQGRWEVCVVWNGRIQTGAGDSPDEAVKDVLGRIFEDVSDRSARENIGKVS